MFGGYTVSTSDMDNMEVARSWQFEYTNDVYTDAWKLCVGGESCSEIWVAGLEYMGNLPCDRVSSGMSVSDGDYV